MGCLRDQITIPIDEVSRRSKLCAIKRPRETLGGAKEQKGSSWVGLRSSTRQCSPSLTGAFEGSPILLFRRDMKRPPSALRAPSPDGEGLKTLILQDLRTMPGTGPLGLLLAFVKRTRPSSALRAPSPDGEGHKTLILQDLRTMPGTGPLGLLLAFVKRTRPPSALQAPSPDGEG